MFDAMLRNGNVFKLGRFFCTRSKLLARRTALRWLSVAFVIQSFFDVELSFGVLDGGEISAHGRSKFTLIFTQIEATLVVGRTSYLFLSYWFLGKTGMK